MNDLVERGTNKPLIIRHHCDRQDGSGVVLQVSHLGYTDVFSTAQPVSYLSDRFSLFLEASGTRYPKSQAKEPHPARFIGSWKKHGAKPGLLLPAQRSREHRRP